MDPYNPANPGQVPLQVPQPEQAATVITNQPGSVTVVQIKKVDVNFPRGTQRGWSTGLCGCFEDISSCLCGVFFPCYSCYLASEMGEPCCTPMCSTLVAMRANFRGKHNLQGSIIEDEAVVCWCRLCAECQMERELKNMRAGRATP